MAPQEGVEGRPIAALGRRHQGRVVAVVCDQGSVPRAADQAQAGDLDLADADRALPSPRSVIHTRTAAPCGPSRSKVARPSTPAWCRPRSPQAARSSGRRRPPAPRRRPARAGDVTWSSPSSARPVELAGRTPTPGLRPPKPPLRSSRSSTSWTGRRRRGTPARRRAPRRRRRGRTTPAAAMATGDRLRRPPRRLARIVARAGAGRCRTGRRATPTTPRVTATTTMSTVGTIHDRSLWAKVWRHAPRAACRSRTIIGTGVVGPQVDRQQGALQRGGGGGSGRRAPWPWPAARSPRAPGGCRPGPGAGLSGLVVTCWRATAMSVSPVNGGRPQSIS